MDTTSGKNFKFQLVGLSVLISLGLIIASYFYYTHEKKSIKSEKQDDLKAISEIKVSQLIQWHNERLSEAVFFSSLEPNLSYARGVVYGNKSDAARYKNNLLHIMSNKRYENIFMLDRFGNTIFSVVNLDEPTDTSINAYSKNVFEKGKVYLRDFYKCNSHGEMHLEIMAPIFDKDKKVIAAVVFRINPHDYLFPIIEDWPLPSISAETYIVRKQDDIVMYLSPLRHSPGSIFKFNPQSAEIKSTAFWAVSGYEGVFEGVNYKGEKVISDIRKVPDTPWYIISEEWTSEVYKELNRMSILVFILSFITILLVGAAMSWIYYNRQRKIYKELYSKSNELQSNEGFRRKLIEIRLDFFEYASQHSLIETLTRTLDKISGFTGSKVGFLYFMMPEKKTISIQSWKNDDENIFYHFVTENGFENIQETKVWLKCNIEKEPFICNKCNEFGNVDSLFNKDSVILRQMFVPVFMNEKIVALFGFGNKLTDYTDLDVELVSSITDMIWVAAESKEKEDTLKTSYALLKDAVEALKQSEKSYRELIDGMNESVWIIGFDGVLIDVNNTTLDVLGYTKEEILAIGIYGVDTSLKKEMIIEMAGKMSEEEIQIFETSHKTKDGKLIPMEIYSSLVNYQGKKTILSIARDISQRKRDEGFQQLLYEIARTSTVTNELIDFLQIVCKKLGNIMDVTNFYVAQYIPETETLRKIIFVNEFFDEEEWDTEHTLSGFVVRSGRTLIISGKDREKFAIENNLVLQDEPAACWLGVPLMDEQEVRGVLVVLSYNDENAFDVNSVRSLEMVAHELGIVIERSRMIQVLISAKEKAEESDRLKTAFLANISHEIRTPMNGILGFLELLTDPGIDDQQRELYLDIMNKSGQRLLATINDIVEISKIEAGQIEVYESEVKINEVLDYHHQVFSKMASDKNIDLIRSYLPELEDNCILTDKFKLEGILTNLLNNAVKFTKSGKIEFGNYIKEGFMIFFVKDTGMGIPPEKIKTIFDRFVQGDLSITRPYEGSGLGLSIVKAYLDKMGGKIWVESTLGVGSTFYFSIPYKPVRKKSNKIDISIKHIEKRNINAKILIAEDDEVSYEYIKTILGQEPLELIHCNNGDDAVKIAREIKDISLILMDIKMPGINGLDAVRLIRSFNKQIPIIALTAYAFSNDRDEAIRSGCNDYLSKPVNRINLVNKINDYI